MRVLVTGAEGFVGPYLIRELREYGHEPVGTYLQFKPDLPEAEALYEVDVTDEKKLRWVVKEVEPEAVFHLAALAHPAGSFEKEKEVWRVNEGGTKNLLSACVFAGLRPKVLLVGSAQEYGIPESIPIREDHPLRPLNPYARSKAAAEEIGRSYLDRLPVLFTRSFNHTGPGHADHYVLPSFAKQIAAIEKGNQEPFIRTGNIELKRDFLHVKDVVRAYRLLIERGKVGEAYNVASGEAYRIGDLTDEMIFIAGIEARVVKDPELCRPGDPPIIRGDRSKITKETGWCPEIKIERLLEELLQHWRERV